MDIIRVCFECVPLWFTSWWLWCGIMIWRLRRRQLNNCVKRRARIQWTQFTTSCVVVRFCYSLVLVRQFFTCLVVHVRCEEWNDDGVCYWRKLGCRRRRRHCCRRQLHFAQKWRNFLTYSLTFIRQHPLITGGRASAAKQQQSTMNNVNIGHSFCTLFMTWRWLLLFFFYTILSSLLFTSLGIFLSLLLLSQLMLLLLPLVLFSLERIVVHFVYSNIRVRAFMCVCVSVSVLI